MGFDYQTRAGGEGTLSSHACTEKVHFFTNYQIGEYRVKLGEELAWSWNGTLPFEFFRGDLLEWGRRCYRDGLGETRLETRAGVGDADGDGGGIHLYSVQNFLRARGKERRLWLLACCFSDSPSNHSGL